MKIISFYSYKGGTGRTITLANVSILLAMQGYKVACLDLDVTAPGLDVAFRLEESVLPSKTIADFLKGMPIPVKEMLVKLKEDLDLFIFPMPRLPGETPEQRGIEPIIDGMNDFLKPLYKKICDELKVDFILSDARSGYARESAVHFAFSDIIFVISRFSRQHLIGTAKIVEILEEIQENIPSLKYYVVINDLPRDLPQSRKTELYKLEEEYDAILIYESRELRWDDRVVVLDKKFKDHQLIEGYQKIVNKIIS